MTYPEMLILNKQVQDSEAGKMRNSKWMPVFSIADAWEVVTLLHSQGWQFDVDMYEGEPTVACFYRKQDDYGRVDPHCASGETAPVAICRAALDVYNNGGDQNRQR